MAFILLVFSDSTISQDRTQWVKNTKQRNFMPVMRLRCILSCLRIIQDKLSQFGYWGACHWHSGVEIVSILDGTMDFFINGQIVTLLPKSILLVNSKRMHYGFSDTKDECTFIDMIVEPSLFDSSCSSIQKQIDNSFGRS